MASHNIQATRAIKPTEVGDAAQQSNPDKTQMNKGGFSIRGYPRRGDRGGDTLTRRILTLIKDRFLAKVGLQIVNYQAPNWTFKIFVAKRRRGGDSADSAGSQ